MNYKRILTIQDISCVGQCSMTVALPILSACGQETCILPSAVLSTHTGGFSFPAIRDLTEDLPGIRKHWQQENITFDAIYTGYLGSTKQIAYVSDILAAMTSPGGKTIVDPAMADNGMLYKGFDQPYVDAMRELCLQADVIVPNVTEACMLTGMEYRESLTEAYIQELISGLHDLGCRQVVLTGVGFHPGQTGVLICGGGQTYHYVHEKIGRGFHGTGDAFASAFVGAWMGGKSMEEAAEIAADFICRCIRNTIGDTDHWYGVKFETALPYLISRLYN